MSKSSGLRCVCGKAAPWLTEVEGRWVGPCCVPDERWKMYPGWREREKARAKTRKKRAAQARRNFQLQGATA